MFNVGANNPNVGNDRRQQLIQQMAQQLAARYAQHQNMDPGFGGGAQPGGDQLGGVFMKRRRSQLLPTGASTRPIGAGRETASTDMVGNPIPGQGPHMSLRPGRMEAPSHLNPSQGHIIPGVAAIPPQAQAPPPPQVQHPAAAQSAPAGAPPPPQAPAPPPPPAPAPDAPAAGMDPGSSYNPVNPDSGQSAYVPSAPQSNTFVPNTQYQPQSFDGSSGLVPLGNGRYLDLSTGAIRGMPTGASGLGGNGLRGTDRRF